MSRPKIRVRTTIGTRMAVSDSSTGVPPTPSFSPVAVVKSSRWSSVKRASLTRLPASPVSSEYIAL